MGEELSALVESVQQLNRNATRLGENQTKINVSLAEIEEKLPDLATKQEVDEKEQWIRRILAGVIVALILAVVAWGVTRIQDSAREEDRREQLAADARQDRQNLLRGCERANDQRSTLRSVIENAYAPAPIPDGLSKELTELIRQSQENAAARRDALLSLPGIQPINCEEAYPPLAIER